MVSFVIATCRVTMSTAQQLRETGEAMGLKGSELVIFVREQQTLEDERKAKEREDKAKEDERKAKEEERLEKARLFEFFRKGQIGVETRRASKLGEGEREAARVGSRRESEAGEGERAAGEGERKTVREID